MTYTILDCFTDEPAGLGVPPYLGTYPRYLYGYLRTLTDSPIHYLTIDDMRKHVLYEGKIKEKHKTDIRVYNFSTNQDKVSAILKNTSELIIIIGVQAPGKYLSALPGTLSEVLKLVKNVKCKKILTGPALFGTSLEGGKYHERVDMKHFDEIRPYTFPFTKVKEYSVLGASLLSQIPSLRIAEIETGRGCSSTGCNFCTEPLKSRLLFRSKSDIVNEINALRKEGVVDIRLGKQACFYTYPAPDKLLADIRSTVPDLRTLHIDNVIPGTVLTSRGDRITRAIVKYCTPGNIAAFGVESFDPAIVDANNLTCHAETSYEAIKRVNEIGAEMGSNGMYKYLPGINILFGLEAESKKTHEHNMKWLQKIYDDGLLVRRINIRQVAVFEGTKLHERAGVKYLKKNKKYYWKWRNEIRQNIDLPMLDRLVPKGHVLKDVRMEVHDGKNTFGRQLGSYPLVVGVKKKLNINEFYDIKVTGHMLRSITGEVIS